MILDQFRGHRVEQWIEMVVDLHHRLLVMDEIEIMVTTVVRNAVIESGSRSKIMMEIGIEIGVLLPHVGRLLQFHLSRVDKV